MSILMNIFRSNVAEIGTPVKGEVTTSSIAVTGSVEWYKDAATWGVAYKKSSASSWTHSSSTSKSISKTLSGLDAATAYDIKLYVKYQGVYQYGPAIEVTTEAEPTPDPDPDPTPEPTPDPDPDPTPDPETTT